MTVIPDITRAPHLGATPNIGGTCFRLWSTRAQNAAVRVNGQDHPLQSVGGGVFETTLPVGAGARYQFVLDGEWVPDPYARFLPDGVHFDAEVVDLSAYPWQHPAAPRELSQSVIYELHLGTFTPEGTLRSAIEKLPYLVELGVTTVELMPLAAFPGARGWGYDGVALYAPFAGYGRPEDVQAFVDAAHGLGLSVFLDVVYNHFGPDGNYLARYSPEYFTERFHTPWGAGLDYREPHMRRFVIENALMWLSDYRFDGLRLDATQEIHDDSDVHILRELALRVHALPGRHLLMAEDYRNLPGLVTEDRLDGIWVDDFHHTVRTSLTGERDGYYAPFERGAAALAQVIRRGWVFEGQIWPLAGELLNKPRGAPADRLAAGNLIYFIQNHDQIGNRAQGERLDAFPGVGAAGLRGASLLLLTLPMTPLIFQGQEWATSTPFLFFSDHKGELGRLVSEGRAREFGHFQGFDQDVPDPQDTATFLASKLNWHEREEGEHARTLKLYREALKLRHTDPVLREARRDTLEAGHDGEVLWVRRADEQGERVLLWNLGDRRELASLKLPFELPEKLLLDSEGATSVATLATHQALLLGRDSG